MKFITILYLIIFISENIVYSSNTPLIRTSLFSKQLNSTNVVGWESDEGGRSWTNKDYIRFNKFIENISNSTEGLNTLRSWGIPHDCFDAIIGLHFIFSLKNGLAVNYGQGFESTKYFDQPQKMIQSILLSFGTYSSQSVLYPVDIFEKNNISSGLIFVHSGSPGHAVYLVSKKNNGLFYRIQGPYPVGYAVIEKEFFFKHKPEAGASLRRFPIYKRVGASVLVVVSDLFPRGTVVEQEEFFSGSESYWPKLAKLVNEQAIPVNYLFSKFKETFCSKIKERIERVNKGYTQCNRELEPNEKKCSDSNSSDYSTPGFDRGLTALNNVWNSLIDELKEGQQIPALECKPFNFFKGTIRDNKSIQYKFSVNNPNDLKSINPIIFKMSYDPMETLFKRWGLVNLDFSEIGVEVLKKVKHKNIDISGYVHLLKVQEGIEIRMKVGQVIPGQIINIVIEDEAGRFREVLSVKVLLQSGSVIIPVNIPQYEMLSIVGAGKFEESLGKEVLIMYY